MSDVCTTCGEENARDAQFCSSCRAYLGWQDQATRTEPPPVTPTVESHSSLTPETHAQPRTPAPDSSDDRDPFQARIELSEVELAPDGAPAAIIVRLTNTSRLVDGYVVEAVNAPPWLELLPGRVELLPSTSGTLAATLRIATDHLVPAQ